MALAGLTAGELCVTRAWVRLAACCQPPPSGRSGEAVTLERVVRGRAAPGHSFAQLAGRSRARSARGLLSKPPKPGGKYINMAAKFPYSSSGNLENRPPNRPVLSIMSQARKLLERSPERIPLQHHSVTTEESYAQCGVTPGLTRTPAFSQTILHRIAASHAASAAETISFASATTRCRCSALVKLSA